MAEAVQQGIWMDTFNAIAGLDVVQEELKRIKSTVKCGWTGEGETVILV